MKKTLIIFFIAASLAGNAQNSVKWENPISVNDGTTGNTRPRIALLNNTTPIITWTNESTRQAYATRINAQGSFESPVKLTPNGVNVYNADWTGAEIAANSDTVYVVFKAEPTETGAAYLVRSFDGGITFSDTIRIDPVDNKIAWLPTVSIKEGGNPVVAYMENDANWVDPRFVVLNSTDGGATFSATIDATKGISPGEVCDCCPANILVKDTLQIMLYRNNLSNVRTMWATFSYDNGNTFTNGLEVDKTLSSSNVCLATGPSGLVYGDSLWVVWKSGTTNARVYISSTSLASLQLGTHSVLSNQVASGTTQNYPRIKGNFTIAGIVWQETSNSNSDIIFSWTEDGAASLFTRRDTLNTNLSGSQINPDIAFGADNTFHVTWQDDLTGNVMYRKGRIGDFTGINKLSNKSVSLKATPNPSSTGTTIEAGSDLNGKIKVYDFSGKEVLQKKLTTGKLFLSNEETGKGIFFIKAETPNGPTVLKLVVL